MGLISIYKVISSIPSSLDANALYLVRTGTGFDLYVSDSTGSVAYQINSSGGGGGLSNIVEDTNPQLGGDLDLNGNDIAGTGNIRIAGEIEADIHIGSLRGEIQFKAKAGEALTKGDPVYISSYDTVGNTPIVAIADANDSAKMPCFGLANKSVSLNASVNVVTFGTLSGLDTSSFGLGDTLYISNTGTLTNSKPTGELSLIQNIGKVQRVDNSSGSIKVGGAGRTNDVPNLDQGNVFIGNASNQAETRGLALDDIEETATNKHFTSGDEAKFNGIESGATADQTAGEIKTAYESNADTNAFTDSEKTKLAGLAAGADVNVNSDWNAVSGDAQILNKPTTITSSEQTKLGHISIAQAVDLDTMESNVATNNAKISNATHTGDVTGSTALTISDEAVTNAKMAHVETGTVKGRTTAGTGGLEDLDIDTTLKTALSLTKSDVGLNNVANVDTTNASNISSGTLAEPRLPNINADNTVISNLEVDNLKSGVLDTDLTTVSSNDDTLASAKAIKTYVDNNSVSSIADESVTNPKLAHISTNIVKGRLTAGTGDVEDITVTALKTAINVVKGDVGLSSVQNINVKNGWSQNSDKYIASSEIRARNGNGLKLYNDAANSGLLVTDSGQVQASNGILITGDWFRVNGNNGIYWQTHGGGWYMQDTTYMRAYNNKIIYTANDIRGNRFVDNNNTNRYIDGNSQSQLEGVTLSNVKIRRVGFRNGDHSMLEYSQYAYNSSGNYATVHGRLNIFVAQGWDADSNVMRFDNQGYGNKTAYIYGNLSVTGSVSKGSGSFDIAHPDPKKKETHRLRHYFVETPSAGGNIYKYQINCNEGDNYLDLPDYFEHLNQDSLVWANPFKHFGRAWGEVVEGGKRARIVVEKSGLYNVLIFGDRKDEISLQDFDKYGVEYKVDKHQKNIGVTLKK